MPHNDIKRVVIIPARGGSKRIPSKNVFPIFGIPILLRSINIVRNSQLFSKILVSTDSDKILKLCDENNIQVSGKRPDHLATDDASLLEVLSFEVRKLVHSGEKFDELWLYSPTACLLESSDLNAASHIFQSISKSHSLLSVVKSHTPIEWALEIKQNELIPKDPDALKFNSQEFATTYFDAGCFAIYSFPNFLDLLSADAITYSPFILPRHKGVDVDNFEDIVLVEMLIRANAEK
jgi:pseudaminic acid cytidylyltransferase